MQVPTINVDLDKKCSQCRKPGALPNGFCLECMAKKVQNGNFDDILKEAKKKRIMTIAFDFNKGCTQCHIPGAAENGLCIICMGEMYKNLQALKQVEH